MLRADYLAGEEPNVQAWGRRHRISENTISKATVGWGELYRERQAVIAQRALERITNQKAKALVNRFRAGRLLVARSLRQFTKASLDETTPKQLSEIIKIGIDIQDSLESKPQTQVNVQVNNVQQLDPATAASIREWSKHHARNDRNGESLLVGNEEDSKGGQPEV